MLKRAVELFVYMLVSLLALFYITSYGWQYRDIDIEKELKSRVDKSYITSAINKSIQKYDFDLAYSYLSLAKNLGIEIDTNTTKRLNKSSNSLDTKLHKASDFFNGFIYGEANSTASLAGSVVSDFTVVGDIKDVYTEGSKYIQNRPYDKFVLYLGIIGLGLEATTLASFGTSATMKVGISALKAAKKGKMLTDNFTVFIMKRISKSIDTNLLKNIHFNSFSLLKRDISKINKSIKFKYMEPVLRNISIIKRNTSISDTLRIMKYIDNEKDLQKTARITKRFKKSSLALFKILGKGAFRVVKALRYTLDVAVSLLLFILSLLLAIIRLFRG